MFHGASSLPLFSKVLQICLYLTILRAKARAPRWIKQNFCFLCFVRSLCVFQALRRAKNAKAEIYASRRQSASVRASARQRGVFRGRAPKSVFLVPSLSDDKEGTQTYIPVGDDPEGHSPIVWLHTQQKNYFTYEEKFAQQIFSGAGKYSIKLSNIRCPLDRPDGYRKVNHRFSPCSQSLS